MCHKKGETEVESDQKLIIRIKTPLSRPSNYSHIASAKALIRTLKRFLCIKNQNNSIPRYTPLNEPAF